MTQLTTAGRLLHDLHSDSASLRDTVVNAAGVSLERADLAMLQGARLSLSEQLRLSEAAALLAPAHARTAMRLRGQALAARSFEKGEHVERHNDSPADKWERCAPLRR